MQSNSKADYNRSVLAYLASIENEDDTMLTDLQGDSLEAELRRAAVDGIIAKMWDRNLFEFCDAMRIAGISAQQAALVMKTLTTLHERRAE